MVSTSLPPAVAALASFAGYQVDASGVARTVARHVELPSDVIPSGDREMAAATSGCPSCGRSLPFTFVLTATASCASAAA